MSINWEAIAVRALEWGMNEAQKLAYKGLMREIQRLRDGIVERDNRCWGSNSLYGGFRECTYCGGKENMCKPDCPRVVYPRSPK